MNSKKTNKAISVLLVLALLCALLAGCGSKDAVKETGNETGNETVKETENKTENKTQKETENTAEVDNRPVVVVQALSTCEDMLKSIEEQCPDINIKWYLSSQVHENAYVGMTDTPDILLRQAYYMDENAKSYLKDISEYEVTGYYSKTLIDSFRDEDGALYWLPVLGTGTVIVANTSLFEENNIEIPHDYESLLSTDKAFKALGIDGMCWPLSDSYAYSAMYVAQSLGADLLSSVDGTKWRATYMANEADTDYTLDDVIWPEMFKRFKQAFDEGLIDETDMVTSDAECFKLLKSGKCAMGLINTANINTIDIDVTVLPMFDTNGTGWLPLYMNLRVGVSANVTDDRLESVLKVLKAYISTETFNAYFESRGGVIPMNNDASALPENLAGLKDVISGGYTFLQTQDQNGGLIDGLNAAMHTMFNEGLDADAAYEACKTEILNNRKTQEAGGLNDNDESAVFFTSEVEYSNLTDENHNNPAGSAIVNTLLDAYNAYGTEKFDVMLMEGNVAGAPIRKGNYYADANNEISNFSSNFHYIMNAARQVYSATMTVEELIQYINTSFYYFHRIDDGLAIMAGASYKVEKYPEGLTDDKLPFTPNYVNSGRVANLDNYPTCYVCTGIYKDGEELPGDTVLRVLVGRVEMFYITEKDPSLPSEWVGFDSAVKIYNEDGTALGHKDLLRKWLTEGNKFTEPTQYVTITEAQTSK